MKILFINKFLDKHTIYRTPLGILYLSAALKQAGHDVFVCEPNREDPFEKTAKIKPDVIGYSLRTGFHRYYLDLNRRLKKQFKFLAVFGGPHATFFPEMIDEEGVDAVALGECERSLVDLADRFKRGAHLETDNFWFKTEKGMIKNALRPLEVSLDKLSFPDRALLDGYREIRFAKIHNFITSRGCPYDCSYCFNHRLREMYPNQKYIRRRSVDNVIEEIQTVAGKYDLQRVHFEDDTFNMDKEWLREFAQKYPRIPFKCNVRANLVDEEAVSLLKQARCISVTFGIEAGNDRIRNEILKRQMSKEQMVDCANLLKKYKINFITENILGNPTSALADDIETLDLNLACQPDYANVSLLQPYPKTEVFRIASASGQFDEKMLDRLESFFDSSALEISDREQRINLQRIFPLIVAFPFLRRFLNFLLKRNYLRPVYALAYNLWRPYALILKIMPHRMSPRDFFWTVRRYLTD